MTAVIRRALVAVAVMVVAAAVAGCTSATPGGTEAAPTTLTLPSGLPVERVSSAAPVRLADGIAPPTNRWYSSLVFAPEPLPVYPFPLAFAARADGFTVQSPPVSATGTTVAAPFTGGLSVGLSATGFTVVRADPVSVTMAFTDPRGTLAEVTIAEGSPVVGIVAERDLTLTLGAEAVPTDDSAWTLVVDGVVHLLVAPGAELAGGEVLLPAGTAAQLAVLPPDGAAPDWIDALAGPVDGVTTTAELDVTAGTATTRLEYTGTDATVVVPFPGRTDSAECSLGTYATIHGPAPACVATALEWSVPLIDAAAQYDLDGLDAATKTALGAQLAADLDASGPLPADTYFGGKALARLAALLALARSLGDEAQASAVADRLTSELEPWLAVDGCVSRAERCFVLDETLRLLVGKTPSFGSEEGNDHHFHSGYFLYAGAVLAAERPGLVSRMRPIMTALAADIAAGADDDALPALRVFDPYRGHSWASGLSSFGDGNNQESSSEAVAAWNGLALWAEVAGEEELRTRALWLLSSEADAARSMWREPDPDTLPAPYAHGIVSLTWGAKREYATWFSAEPSAILGIQVLPLGPVSLAALAGDPARVAANVADAGGDAAFGGALGDYVLGYSALAGADALAHAEDLVAARATFDDGWSKSAALAWLAAVRLSAAG